MAALVHMVERHGQTAVAVGSRLLVACWGTTRDGRVVRMAQLIPGTREAVRRWLGY